MDEAFAVTGGGDWRFGAPSMLFVQEVKVLYAS
jgi:hypothetical protein